MCIYGSIDQMKECYEKKRKESETERQKNKYLKQK
jgi:hypothetical protein